MFLLREKCYGAHAHGAFTILEMLVAMAVLAMVLLLLLGMVDGTSKVWKENQSAADVSREARAALQVMARDTRTLLYSSDIQTVHLPGGEGEQLAMLTLQSKGAQRGGNRSDLCTVGYFVAYDRPSRFAPLAQNSRNLYRYLRGSDETFSCLQAGENVFADFENVTALADPALHPNVTLLARNVNRVEFESIKLSSSGDPEPAGMKAPEAISVELHLVPTNLASRLSDEIAWSTLPDEKQLTSSSLLQIPDLQ